MKEMILTAIFFAVLLVFSSTASANISYKDFNEKGSEQKIQEEANGEITISNRNFSPLAKKFFWIYCNELKELVEKSNKKKIKGKWFISVQENLSLKPAFTIVWIIIFDEKDIEDPRSVGVVYMKNTGVNFDPTLFAKEAAKMTIKSFKDDWLWFKKQEDGWTIDNP